MKHIYTTLLCALLCATLLCLCACQAQPAAAVQARTFTVHIVAESQGIEETLTLKSELATLAEIIEAEQQTLGATFSTSATGMFVTGMGGYTPASGVQEYFALMVNGVDSMVGASEVRPAEGDVITFELRTY